MVITFVVLVLVVVVVDVVVVCLCHISVLGDVVAVFLIA